MGDAAGQRADCLHLLRLCEFLLERLRLGGVDDVENRRLAVRLAAAASKRRHIDLAADLLALRAERDVDRGDAGLADARFLKGRCNLASNLGAGLVDQFDETAAALGRAFEEQSGKGGIGAHDAAFRIDGSDTERGGLEKPGEAGLGRRRSLLAAILVLDALDDGDRNAAGDRLGQQGGGPATAVLADEVEIQSVDSAVLAVLAGHQGGKEVRAAVGDEVLDTQVANAGSIAVAEPSGQAVVQGNDLAGAIDAQDTDRGAGEIGEAAFEDAARIFLALAIDGDVFNLPVARHCIAGGSGKWHLAHSETEPAALATGHSRQADIFGRGVAALGGPAQAEQAFGAGRVARQKGLQRTDLAECIGSDEGRERRVMGQKPAARIEQGHAPKPRLRGPSAATRSRQGPVPSGCGGRSVQTRRIRRPWRALPISS